MDESRVVRAHLTRVTNKGFDFETDDVRVLLVDNAHTFAPTNEFVNDVSADEVTNASGTGYERKTLATKSHSINQGVEIPGAYQEGTSDLITRDVEAMTAANLTYTNINTNERIGGGYLFVQVTDDTDSYLIGSFQVNDIPSDVVTLPEVVITPDSDLGYTFNFAL